MVGRDTPAARATRATPPWPNARASTAKHSRRCRSFKYGNRAPGDAGSAERQFGDWVRDASPDELHRALNERREATTDASNPQAELEIDVLELEFEERERQAVADQAAQTSGKDIDAKIESLRDETSHSDSPRAGMELGAYEREKTEREDQALDAGARDVPLADLRIEINNKRDDLSQSTSPENERALAVLERVLAEREQIDPEHWAWQKRWDVSVWRRDTGEKELPDPEDAYLDEPWARYLHRHGASLDALWSLNERLHDPDFAVDRGRIDHRPGMVFADGLQELEDELRENWAKHASGLPLDQLVATRDEIASRVGRAERYFDRREDEKQLVVYDHEMSARITSAVEAWSSGSVQLSELGREVEILQQEADANPGTLNDALAAAAMSKFRAGVWEETNDRLSVMSDAKLAREIDRLKNEPASSLLDQERLAVLALAKEKRDFDQDMSKWWAEHGADTAARTLRIAEAGPQGVMTGTKEEIDRAVYAAYVQGGLDAHTGLIFGSALMVASITPGSRSP